MSTPAPHPKVGAPPPPVRVFVGVKIEPGIAGELAQIARALEREQVKRVLAADMHLTLVPPWNEPSLGSAAEILRRAVESFGPLALDFQRLDYGPDSRRPRLLWAECAASEALSRLRVALLDAFGRSEDRPFRPHVTLARLRGSGAAIARRHPLARDLPFSQEIVSVELLQSPRPGEAGYRIVASAPLAPTRLLPSTPEAG